ncbi:MAG: branched chain amino acid aminotransferase apoenzyme [Acidimicrobiaceae bacterium]|jgi:branched-chain amino acid aminotransferase|nr:branched chain amino acid aminotransferase apoenzyme [Acidimicrobiaceae bacterium]
MPITPTSKIWMDGELVDWEQATVHVLTHSLHYGTAVFEGIRAYPTAQGPAVFRLRDHVGRLLKSAHLLAMEVPFGEDELVEAVKATVAASGLDACYIRPLAYLGYGEMGLNPLPCEVRVAVAVWPWGAYLGEEGMRSGIRLKVSSWARLDPRTLPTAAKATGMYINSSLAKVEAVRAGYDEAILCTTDGYLAEGTGENLFVVRRGEIVTPPSSAVGALDGITADTVRTIAGDLGYTVREELLRRSDLYLADEAFLTGTAAEVVPIASVDDRTIGSGEPGPITRAIQDTYRAVVHGEVDRYKDWLERVG